MGAQKPLIFAFPEARRPMAVRKLSNEHPRAFYEGFYFGQKAQNASSERSELKQIIHN